ncbi:MAG: efflux RND transporter periplasmic adaptor subunit, partial [Alphaproteobacteria bacterium]
SVRVVRVTAQPRQQRLLINGRTEASRRVELRAEAEGRIVEILVDRGDEVEKGQVLARISQDERPARLAQAQALLRQREIEYQAAASLKEKGYRSETSLAAARAELDAAIAVVEQIRIDLEQTSIRAPFDGMIDEGHVELGDYVQIADVAGTIVDLDPILVVGYATEREVGSLHLGKIGAATLIDGTSVEGIISYVSSVADGQTRTYRFELEVPNPDYRIRDGITSRIRIDASESMAVVLSPSVLTLDDNGTVGVKIVTEGDIVEFVPVRILEATSDGVWIEGLPSPARLITVGQDFVANGQRVLSVPVGSPMAAGGES